MGEEQLSLKTAECTIIQHENHGSGYDATFSCFLKNGVTAIASNVRYKLLHLEDGSSHKKWSKVILGSKVMT
jgi:hypothetical protein